METENFEQAEEKKNYFTEVTRLSKYFAMALFIALPFLGGWVGYTYAPTKVVEVEKVVVKENNSNVIAQGEEDTYGWCMQNGGEDVTRDYNAPRTCVLNHRVYKLNCINNEKYSVIKDDTLYAVSNFVVKHKNSPEQAFVCEYSVADGDFVIENSGADYLIALEGDYLLIDSGTGPGPRGLSIFDLSSEKVVFGDLYMGLEIHDNELFYWTPSDIVAAETNCPEYKKNEGNYLSSAIDEYVKLDLATFTKTKLGESRCSSRQ